MKTSECTEKCYAMPECLRCERTKKPNGRAAPLESYYCDSDCPGYAEEPRAGHLWHSERDEADTLRTAGKWTEGLPSGYHEWTANPEATP